MKRLISVHHLRGIAALGVLLSHGFAYVHGYGSQVLPVKIGEFGEARVDVFFVISGFLLTMVTQAPRSRKEFILGRILRLGVPYWSVVLALVGMSLIAPVAFRNFPWTGHDLALSLAFVPSIIRDGSIFPLLEPSWTLSLEVMFYAMIAATLGFAPRHRSMIICAVFCGLAVVGLVRNLPQGQSIAWFYSQTLLVEFGFGILLAHVCLAGGRTSARTAVMLLVVGLIGVSATSLYTPEPFDPVRPLVYGVPAAMIVAGAIFLEMAGFWRDSRVMNLLGNISYSLYLTHVLVLALVAKLLSRHVSGLSGDIAMLLIASAMAIVVAYGFYRLVERPCMGLSDAVLGRGRAKKAPAAGPTIQPAE